MSQSFFFTFVALSATLDLIVAWVVLRKSARHGEGQRRIGLWDMLAALLVCSVAFGMKLIALRFVGFNAFGAICLMYVSLVIVIPLIALGLLLCERFEAWRGRADRMRLTLPVRLVAGVVAVAAPLIGVYATFLETRNTKLETADVAVAPEREGSGTIRIGVLADMQTNGVTDHERNAVARLMALKPDVILIPGDVFQGFPNQFRAALTDLRNLLQQLYAPGGVYFVFGDCDSYDRISALLESTNIRVLRNQCVTTRVNDRLLSIAGIELDYTTPEVRAVINDLTAQAGGDDIRILLSHRPDSVFSLPANSRVDIVIAGHTHGGQVQLPGIGPLLTLSRVPNEVAAGGLHEMNGNPIYVSRGLGRERSQAPSIRFLCPPEITLLTIREP